MPEWWVKLEGKSHGLAAIAGVHSSPECAVHAQDGGYFITSERFDHLHDATKVWLEAMRLVQCVNTLGMLAMIVAEPIEVTTVWERTSAGELIRRQCSPIVHGICVTHADGSEASLRDPETAGALARLQACDDDVRDVMELWSTCAHDWSMLWKVYEIVKHSGDLRAASQEGSVPEKQLVRFKRTANHQRAAGLRTGRHARMSAEPPREPMHIWEAEDTVRRLLATWLVRKARSFSGEAQA